MKKLPLLLAALAVGSSAFGLLALPNRWNLPPPAAGKYTGLLTVRRTLIEDGLETSYTVKVDANIAADGQMTILSAAPEAPGAAANIENSVVRAAPRPPVAVPPPGTIVLKTEAASKGLTPATGGASLVLPSGPLTTTVPFLPSNYVVNGTIPANVSASNRMVYLKYAVTQYRPVPGLEPVPVRSPGILLPMPSPIAVIDTNSSPAASTTTTSTSLANQTSTSIVSPPELGPITVPQVAVSRVSYDFVLRMQRPLPVPASAARVSR